MEIKDVDGETLYTSQTAKSVRDALAEAIRGGSDLRGSNLRYSDLSGSVGAELVLARMSILPEGELIGWKMCREGRIVKLRIPPDSHRSHAAARKCRTERAEVLAIYDPDGNAVDSAQSTYHDDFTYRVGETVQPAEEFDPDRWNECSSGIHFYITRIEAENHE